MTSLSTSATDDVKSLVKYKKQYMIQRFTSTGGSHRHLHVYMTYAQIETSRGKWAEVEAVRVVETVAERQAGTQADCSRSSTPPATASLVRRTAAAWALNCTVDYCYCSSFRLAVHQRRHFSALEHVATVHRFNQIIGSSFHPFSFSYCFVCLSVLGLGRCRRDWKYCHLDSKIAAAAASVVGFLHSRCLGGTPHLWHVQTHPECRPEATQKLTLHGRFPNLQPICRLI